MNLVIIETSNVEKILLKDFPGKVTQVGYPRENISEKLERFLEVNEYMYACVEPLS